MQEYEIRRTTLIIKMFCLLSLKYVIYQYWAQILIVSLQIYAWEIPRKVVFFEIFLHWFTEWDPYELQYHMIFFPKIQLEIPFIRCTCDSY